MHGQHFSDLWCRFQLDLILNLDWRYRLLLSFHDIAVQTVREHFVTTAISNLIYVSHCSTAGRTVHWLHT